MLCTSCGSCASATSAACLNLRFYASISAAQLQKLIVPHLQILTRTEWQNHETMQCRNEASILGPTRTCPSLLASSGKWGSCDPAALGCGCFALRSAYAEAPCQGHGIVSFTAWTCQALTGGTAGVWSNALSWVFHNGAGAPEEFPACCEALPQPARDASGQHLTRRFGSGNFLDSVVGHGQCAGSRHAR